MNSTGVGAPLSEKAAVVRVLLEGALPLLGIGAAVAVNAIWIGVLGYVLYLVF